MTRRRETHKRLREWRHDHALTQQELAEKLGCEPATVSNIETGVRGVGRVLALSIQRVTGIKIGDW